MADVMQAKVLGIDEVRKHFADGVSVFISGGCGEPTAVLEMIEQAALTTKLRVFDGSIPGMTQLELDRISTQGVMNTGFFLPGYREAHQQGRLEYVPAFHSARYQAMDDEYGINIMLIKTSEPNGDGVVSAGVHADYSQQMLDRADLVIAEICTEMPFIDDSLAIPLDDIDYAVHSNAPLVEYGVGASSATDLVIAERISELVDDGDCLQLGIGSLPVSILEKLDGKRNLGIHTGLLTEAVVPLVESGAVNGSKKSIDTGKITTGIVAGSSEFYRWCANCKDLSLRPVGYTHNAAVLAQIDHLFAINTTLEIDLFGQINSETINGKQIGGVGGLVDFLRGARASRGGRSVIALHSTAKKGSISKIRPLLSAAPVTAIRNDIDYVVTEYGVARLSNCAVDKRAESLIAIAHPDFRDELTAQWVELWSKF